MKKTLVLFLFALVTLCASAQTHMKFMGIPINGTISEFTAKLQAKGMTIHPDNKTITEPMRMFKGLFFDMDATFFVHYNPTSKIVYDVRVSIDGGYGESSKNTLTSTKKEIISIIKDKYNYREYEGKTVGGDPINCFDIYIEDGNGGIKYIGEIYTGISESYGKYYLHITYSDSINSKKNDTRKNNDI